MPADVAPTVAVHVLIPVMPVIAQTALPVGATAPVGPATVAVKVIAPPRVALDALATTETDGVAVLTAVVAPEVGAVAK